MWDTLIKIWGAGAVPVTAAITLLVNRRHKNTTETRDSQAEAINSISDGAKDVVELMRSALKPLQLQIDAQEQTIGRLGDQIVSNEAELAEHRKQIRKQGVQLRSFRTWAIQLREQVVEAGIEPIPAPPNVADLFSPNNNEGEDSE